MRISRAAVWVVCSIAVTGLAAAQTIQINRNNKTIAIRATAEATATADIAVVSIGFQIFGPDSQSTYAEAGQRSQAILEALHKAGVKDDSIESTQQQLQRYNDYNKNDTPQERAKKQFVFRQSWRVTVAPRNAAETIRVAIAAGANQSGSIDWRLSDRKALQAKAARNALVKAQAIASNMAEGLHVKLGELIYASNQAPNSNIFPGVRALASATLAGHASGEAQKASQPLVIRPQKIHESATVYAVFAIE